MKSKTTHDYVAEGVVQIQKQTAHITHIEFSFHLSLYRPSETLWFGGDNGTTVLDYLLYSMISYQHLHDVKKSIRTCEEIYFPNITYSVNKFTTLVY